MLIDLNTIRNRIRNMGIDVKGVFHIGAHECEELKFYNSLGITPDDCVWIEALSDKVKEATDKGIPNVYQAVITDKDDIDIKFNVSNNIQSSSILPFGTHEKHHNWVHYTHTLNLKTITIDSFFLRNNIHPSKFTVWNFDIQGAELLALKGASNALQYPKVIYLEVNTEEVYKGCGLLDEIDKFLGEKGFVRFETKMSNAGWGDALYIRIT